MIAGLLLAAGRGTRFGGDKLVAPLGGRPVIRWSAESLAAAVDATWVVVTPDAHEAMAALAGLELRVVEHAGHAEGMGSSLSAGIGALASDAEAVVIALADQPLVSRAVIARLIDRWRSSGAKAVAPRYRDGRGHPVLFDRACFPMLRALHGDRGARDLLASLGDALSLVEVDELTPLDVDTREALARVERMLGEDAGRS